MLAVTALFLITCFNIIFSTQLLEQLNLKFHINMKSEAGTKRRCRYVALWKAGQKIKEQPQAMYYSKAIFKNFAKFRRRHLY